MNRLDHSQIADLVLKAQKGDQDAFAALYTATVDRQLYFATAFLQDARLAEDAVQEAYLRMFSSIEKLQNPRVFVAYLNRICYNVCVDHKKKIFTQKFELDDDIIPFIEDKDVFASPDINFEISEMRDDLQDALSELTDREKSAFMLRFYYEYNIQEIAKELSISESTVKRTVKSATEKLKNLLEGVYNIGEGGRLL